MVPGTEQMSTTTRAFPLHPGSAPEGGRHKPHCPLHKGSCHSDIGEPGTTFASRLLAWTVVLGHLGQWGQSQGTILNSQPRTLRP